MHDGFKIVIFQIKKMNIELIFYYLTRFQHIQLEYQFKKNGSLKRMIFQSNSIHYFVQIPLNIYDVSKKMILYGSYKKLDTVYY